MEARRYAVTLIGETPLLMHSDDVEWADTLHAWRHDPANKKISVAGDDRSPAFTWVGYTYHEGNRVIMPSDNLMTTFRNGGAMVPTGKGNKTFKAQTQSGIVVNEYGWELLANGKPVPWDQIKELINESDFEKHKAVALSLGFELFVKRAALAPGRKNVRVRPRFDNWSCSGTLTVLDPAITTEVLTTIITYAGVYSGLCDWRPSSKTPGSFGKFRAEVKEIK